MYLFDFKKTVAQLRELVQKANVAHPLGSQETSGLWLADAKLEGELAAQAIEFLFDHLIQFEQFTAAAHLVAWCIPASIRGSKRMTKLVEDAVLFSSKMQSQEMELDLVRASAAQKLPKDFLLNTDGLAPRAHFWLRCVQLRRAKSPLEFGTGGGANIFHCSDRSRDTIWTGLDLTPSQVEHNKLTSMALRDDRPNTRFISEAEAKPHSFDCIGILDVLEHTAYPAELVARAEQLLAPGGLMVLVVPNGPWSLATDNRSKENLACNHVNVSSAIGMIQFVQDRNGEILTLDLIPGPDPSHGNSSVCIAYEVSSG